jgi:hypothetical protein
VRGRSTDCSRTVAAAAAAAVTFYFSFARVLSLSISISKVGRRVFISQLNDFCCCSSQLYFFAGTENNMQLCRVNTYTLSSPVYRVYVQ